jgi:hypothetical protein
MGEESNIDVGHKQVCKEECDRNEQEVPDGGDIEHTGLECSTKYPPPPNYWKSVNIGRELEWMVCHVFFFNK